METSNTRRRTAGALPRTMLAAAVSLAAINVLGLGAFASWTDSEVDQLAVDAGTLGIVLGDDGPTNRMSVSAANIAPGDVIQRAVQLANDGSIDLRALELTTSAANGSLLFGGADRLQLRMQSCDVAWTETVEASGGYSYTCPGQVTDIIGNATTYGEVQQAGSELAGMNALEAGGTDNLVVDLKLPESAGNEYQGLSEVITFRFDAVQRDGTFR